MAPQENIPVEATVLSTIGTVLWCVQLIPQIWHNYRRKNTDGFPGTMMFLWAACAVPFGAYSIIQKFAIPIQIQPQMFGFFALVAWGQILYYNNGWSILKATITMGSCVILFGGLEVTLIYTLRIPYENGTDWPITLIGVIAAVLLAMGLLPPYWELWKRSGRVVGIDWSFLAIDWFGSFFSLLAIVFQESFDALGGTMYIVCMLLEGGIFTSHILWKLRTLKLHKEAKRKGVEFDEMPEARKYQWHKPSSGVTDGDMSARCSQGETPLPCKTDGKRGSVTGNSIV